MTKVIRAAKGTSGNQVVKYRHVDGQVFDAYIVGRTTGALATPGTPTVTTIGTTGATTYSYRIVARNSSGVTLPGTAGTTTGANGNATLSTSNFQRVTWAAVPNAESYDVYGRTGGSELLLGNTTGTTYDDTTNAAGSGALPGSNTTAAGANIRVPQLKTQSAPTITPGTPITITPTVTRVGGGLLKNAVPLQTTRAQTGVILTTGAR